MTQQSLEFPGTFESAQQKSRPVVRTTPDDLDDRLATRHSRNAPSLQCRRKHLSGLYCTTVHSDEQIDGLAVEPVSTAAASRRSGGRHQTRLERANIARAEWQSAKSNHWNGESSRRGRDYRTTCWVPAIKAGLCDPGHPRFAEGVIGVLWSACRSGA